MEPATDTLKNGTRAAVAAAMSLRLPCRGPVALALVMALFAIGCGGAANEYDSTVSGTITVNGELAKSGSVTFHPVDEGLPSIGRIHSDGSYSLRTGQGDLQETDGGTVIPGEYLVTVSATAPPVEGSVVGEGGPPVPGPSLIHSKYAEKDTSDLRLTVKPGKNVFVLELEAAEPMPPEEEIETPESTEEQAEGEGSKPDEPVEENAPNEITPATSAEPTEPAEAPVPSENEIQTGTSGPTAEEPTDETSANEATSPSDVPEGTTENPVETPAQ